MTNPVPFTNHIGQVINVGDKVLAVTVSAHRYRAREGIYVGKSVSGCPQVRGQLERYGAFYVEKNEAGGHDLARGWPHKGKVEYKKYLALTTSTLQLGRVYALKEA